MKATASLFSALLVLTTACSGGHDDFEVSVGPEAASEVIKAGDGWVLEVTQQSADCVRIRLVADGVTTSCVGLDATTGGWTIPVTRGHGRAFVWAVGRPSAPVQARWWSSECNPCEIEPITRDGVTFLLVELALGEEPWGLQVIDATDGHLVDAWSFIGR